MPPTANPDRATTTSGTAANIPVLANDSDDGTPQALFIESVGSPANGTAVIAGNAIVYTPRAGFLGSDVFSYTISDGADAATASVSVEVLPATTTVWLPFDEAVGTTARDALGRELGTLNGFATPDWVTGKWGGGLRFFADGNADTVVLGGNKGVVGTAARTITFWMNADADQGSAIRSTLVSWGASNGTTAGIRFDINLNHSNGYKLRAEFNASGVNFTTAARSDLRGVGWVHCAVVVPSGATVSQIRGYLDGALATAALEPTTSGGTAINTTSANDVTIGNWATDGARPFRGILDDVRIYPRALSATEIASLAAQSPDQTSAAGWFFRFSGSDLPTASDWTSDSDKDDFPALLEYALGGNPTVASWSISPSISPDGSQFFFNRRKSGLAAAAYQAEHSVTLEGGSWLPVTPGGTLPHPDLTGFEQVIVPLPESPEKRAFIRLRVVGP